MASFAKLNSNNIVTAIVSVADYDCIGNTEQEKEIAGINFLNEIVKEENISWKIITVGDKKRENARIGYTFNAGLNGFIPEQPSFASWTFDTEKWSWESPVPEPEDLSFENPYRWDEESQTWISLRT